MKIKPTWNPDTAVGDVVRSNNLHELKGESKENVDEVCGNREHESHEEKMLWAHNTLNVPRLKKSKI